MKKKNQIHPRLTTQFSSVSGVPEVARDFMPSSGGIAGIVRFEYAEAEAGIFVEDDLRQYASDISGA